uniref:Uncharacterized protein n=1 Tax=Inoviridae sp. ctsTh7 TaxID=2825785 RepID=A0A8S5Q6X7_9VIRU|nr:MAG TPA: hypothetical protein [Inoviridae sp. ctsTh7]
MLITWKRVQDNIPVMGNFTERKVKQYESIFSRCSGYEFH